MRPLIACALALGLLALACDAGAATAGAPVEERPLPPLLTPPGAISQPTAGEGAAPDPLVSDIEVDAGSNDGGGAQGPAAARTGDVRYRPPTFSSSAASGAPASERAATPRGDMPADAAGVLFGQLQELQQEVMMLRGLVEAQQNAIDRLSREQRDRYLDLDRRLSLIGSGAPAQQASGAAGAAITGNESTLDPTTGAPLNGPVDERAAYERAFALTREKRFEEAIPAFRRVIGDFPNGQYAANAWYWLGELYLALPVPDLELARQAFVQVVQLWPDNRKVPDAKYKLGVVYDRLGEPEQARERLEKVIQDHPDSPAARLASSYLDQIEG